MPSLLLPITRIDSIELAQERRPGERASGAREPTLQDLGNVFGESSALISRLRAAQAKGVNQAGMSRQEYAWVRRQSVAAMSELVPVPDKPRWAFADPRLEAASIGHKAMIRLGPDQAARVKAKLAQLRELLAAQRPAG